jgi:hypothetical protein
METLLKMVFDKVYDRVSQEYINTFYEGLLDNVENEHKILYHISRLDIFLDPTHFIGEHANLFRSRFVNDRIEPEVIVTMKTEDFFPELFTVTQDKTIINDIEDEIIRNMKKLKGKTIKDKYKNKNVLKKQKQLPEICDTPYWQIARPNTVIIKENGYFYCLDIVKMVDSFIKNGYFSNYVTGKQVDDDTEYRLRLYYNKEIDLVRKGESLNTLIVMTDDEFTDLENTLKKLVKLREYVIKNGERINGLKTKKVYNDIPKLFRKTLEDITDNREKIEKLLEWLDENIEMIENTMEKRKTPVDEEDIELIDRVPEEYETQNEQEENIIKKYILTEKSIIKNIIDNYMLRIDALETTLKDNLKLLNNKIDTIKSLNELNELKDGLIKQTQSIAGLKTILKDRIERVIELIDNATIMNASRILESDIMLSETTELKQTLINYMNELERIESIEIKNYIIKQ